MSKTFIRLFIFLIVGLVVYSFLTAGPNSWFSRLNPLAAFNRSVQETQDTALSKAKHAVKQMNEKNLQMEQDLAGLEPGYVPSRSPERPAVEPTNSAPPQAHEALTTKVKEAAQTINRNYREIERTDAALQQASPTQ